MYYKYNISWIHETQMVFKMFIVFEFNDMRYFYDATVVLVFLCRVRTTNSYYTYKNKMDKILRNIWRIKRISHGFLNSLKRVYIIKEGYIAGLNMA